MSSIIGKFLTILGLKRRDASILVVGLDNSGKSTIMNYLKRKEDQVDEVVPTVGFTVERLSGVQRHRSGIQLTAFDMSGQGRYRNLWEHYYGNVEGIIFVVDSTDSLRFVVAKDELNMLLKHQSNGNDNNDSGEKFLRKDIPILFFANKMDLKDSLPSSKIPELLGLDKLEHKNWYIQASNALTGQGVQDGIEWLVEQIAKNCNNNGSSASNNNSNNGSRKNRSVPSIPVSVSASQSSSFDTSNTS